MLKTALTAMLLSLFATAQAWAADPLQGFPPAAKGFVRHVLQLAPQDDESAYQVELQVGKTVPLDERNRYFFGGKITEETIKGWGYTRYVLGKLGPMAGTRIAVDPNAPTVPRFVKLGGEPYLIRYNSRLPVVVYTPDDVEVRYRIWSAGTEFKSLEPG
ncbi:ecotin [Methylotetracoccus oryzae]|uniref:ecotin n=1 Tax=Methylotetracoccus oryzae TaxID=1919059 RepID=UPI001118C2C4|nr:ecotin family protein [Methylotetracoccus oryzae]